MEAENTARYKSKRFAVRIVRLYQYLCEEKREFVLSRQILRSGTSIGANLAEAECAISKKDFLATVYKGNIIKNLIMDCQSYTKYRPNETTGGIFVSWRRKEELPTGA